MKNSYYLQQGKWLRECQSPLIALVNDKKKKHQGILKRIVPPMQEAFADFEILDLLQYLQILQYHTDLLQ